MLVGEFHEPQLHGAYIVVGHERVAAGEVLSDISLLCCLTDAPEEQCIGRAYLFRQAVLASWEIVSVEVRGTLFLYADVKDRVARIVTADGFEVRLSDPWDLF